MEMKEDKEAQKKIQEIIELAYRQDPNDPDFDTTGFVEFWSRKIIIELQRLGYQKLDCENCTYKMVALARNE